MPETFTIGRGNLFAFAEALAVESFAVGEWVETNYSGKITTHIIIGKKRMRSQSGVGYDVQPKLRLWRDKTNPYDEWPHEHYDAGWFRRCAYA